MVFFVGRVLPHIEQRLPGVLLRTVGCDPTSEVMSLHDRRVSVTATVSRKPLRELKVWFTAVASNPLCTMQSWHFSLPLRRPYRCHSVVSISSWKLAA